MDTPIIEAVNIHKTYGNLPVLKGIDLSVSRKEFVTIVGESGSGKTTLLQILGTLDQFTKTPEITSTLTIDGEDVTKMRDKALSKFRNQKIGFVFQFHQLLPELSAIENIMLPGMIGGHPQKKLQERALNIMEKLHLENRTHHKPSQMSGGEQQRVAIARSLINHPDIVFADEPSGNLDGKTSQNLHEWLLKIRKEFDTTFVIVTHNHKLAEMADRILEIKNGQIIS